MTSSYACAVYIVCNAGHFNHDFITPGKSIYIKLPADIRNFGRKYNQNRKKELTNS